MSNREISIGFSGSVRRVIILSISTAVFPEPAAADISRVLSLVFIAFNCSFVQLAIIHFPFLLLCQPLNFEAARQTAFIEQLSHLGDCPSNEGSGLIFPSIILSATDLIVS